MHAKQINQLLVLIMFTITLASLAGAGFLINNNYPLFWKYIVSNDNNVKIGTPLENCSEVAKRLNMPITVKGNNIEIQRFEINNPEMLFTKVSVMVMACTQYQLQSMCVGTECPGAAFTAVLSEIK